MKTNSYFSVSKILKKQNERADYKKRGAWFPFKKLGHGKNIQLSYVPSFLVTNLVNNTCLLLGFVAFCSKWFFIYFLFIVRVYF